MILRGSSGAHICIRCQLRLSTPFSVESSLLPHQLPSRGVRLQHNEASRGNPHGSEQDSKQYDDMQEDLNGPEARRLYKSKPKAALWNTEFQLNQKKNRLTKYPLGRLYGFRGHKLREKTIGLGVETLGAPSEVIVLRDASMRFVPKSSVEELEPPETVDILAQLDSERGLISQKEVENNIEELMPKSISKIISWKEFQAIQKQLVNGFTTSQLIKYIDSFDSRRKLVEGKNEQKAQDGSPTPILRIVAWMPGISEDGEHFEEDSLRGYGSEAFTPKQRLVLHLLRQCWRLEAEEVVDSIGELELEIQDTELELLINGRNPPLRLISEKLISDQEEKIEAFRSRRVIRITGGKEKCNFILQEIREILQQVRNLELDLDVISSLYQTETRIETRVHEMLLEPSVLKELALLTETEITRLPNSKLSISCINRNPGTHISTRADVARRLLLTSSCSTADYETRSYGCANTTESLVAVRYEMVDGMSWLDRLRHWMRWTSAVPKALPEKTDGDPQLENKTTASKSGRYYGAIPATLLEEKLIDEKQYDTPQRPLDCISWDREYLGSSSATVGHVLHQSPDSSGPTQALSELFVTEQTVFCPTVLNLSRILGTVESINDLPAATLVMRFMPSPWAKGKPEIPQTAPPIEMVFTVDAYTRELKERDIVAVVDSSTWDVMLPDAILDLRFQHQKTACLRASDYRQLPQVKEFLDNSKLNMMRGQLETPSSLILPVSSHLCYTTSTGLPNSLLPESRNIEYLFAGLEYRNTISFDFEGWVLQYTSIEGGKADGRRGELSLLPRRVGVSMQSEQNESDEGQEVRSQNFVDAAFRLVDRLESFDAGSAQEGLGSKPRREIRSVEKKIRG